MATTDTTDTAETGGGEPGLFDESGVWALTKYSLGGVPFQDIASIRMNRFLLRFWPESGVLATAGCTEMGTEVDIEASTCINAAVSSWECRCFAYTFTGASMAWLEFTPGDAPPPVEGADVHALELAAFADVADAYEFESLPPGLFNSSGEIDSHVFETRALSVWTEVDVNGDAVPDLEACAMSCGGG